MGTARRGLVVLALLLAVACGDDDKPSQDVVESEIAYLFNKASPGTPAAAGCVGARLADEYSPDELVDAKLLTEAYRAPADMPKRLKHSYAVAWVKASIECVDYIEVAAATHGQEIAGFDTALYRDCVDRRLRKGLVRRALVDSYTGDETSRPSLRLSSVLTACADRQK